MTQRQLDDAQIRETAYLFWLDDGQPEGRDQEHWLKAIDALSAPAPKKARKAPAKPRAPKAVAAAAKAPKAKTTASKKPRATKAAKAK